MLMLCVHSFQSFLFNIKLVLLNNERLEKSSIFPVKVSEKNSQKYLWEETEIAHWNNHRKICPANMKLAGHILCMPEKSFFFFLLMKWIFQLEKERLTKKSLVLSIQQRLFQKVGITQGISDAALDNSKWRQAIMTCCMGPFLIINNYIKCNIYFFLIGGRQR